MNLNDTLNLISTIIQTETMNFVTQGSGFYFSRLAAGNGDGPQWREVEEMWLVTNRHVVIPKQQEIEVPPTRLDFCLRKIGNSGALIWDPVVLSAGELETLAKFHPDKSVDVAVVNIYEAVTNRIKSGEHYASPYLLHSDNFAGKNNIEVEASSDILVAGYPKGFYDEVNLFPIVKSGIIASRWGSRVSGPPLFSHRRQTVSGFIWKCGHIEAN